MPTFNITMAHDVSVYGSVTVEANDLAAAVEQVRADLDGDGTIWEHVSDVDWSTSYGFRVVSVQDDTGATSAEGIRISEADDSVPLSAEEVLTAVTVCRITK
jgi:hypothetical protein